MGLFLGSMVCPLSNLSLHVLSASSEVQGRDQASFEKGVDQANAGGGYVGPTGKQGRNKADITWMSFSTPLSPSASPLSAPRQLCLDELLFDSTAGSAAAATVPPVACGSALPSTGCGTCPALPPPCGPTLLSSGCGSDPAPLPTRGLTLPLGSLSGLVLSSVPWDEFVMGVCAA